jgi:hypothetical protein
MASARPQLQGEGKTHIIPIHHAITLADLSQNCRHACHHMPSRAITCSRWTQPNPSLAAGADVEQSADEIHDWNIGRTKRRVDAT